MECVTDPRLNLPSASSFWMDVACPGRQTLMKSVEHQAVESDELALRGTRIHKALQLDDESGLEADDIDDYRKAKAYKEQVFQQWLSSRNDGVSVIESREERLWLHDAGLNPLLSGQADVVFVASKSALVLDFKSGFLSNLTPSDANWQLRVLAVLTRRNWNVEDVTVGFIKPKSRYEPADLTHYDKESLDFAESKILIALAASKDPHEPRIPGKQCRWCPVKHRCVEAAGYALVPSVIVGTSVEATKTKAEMFALVQRLSPTDWAFIEKRRRESINIFEAVQQCLKSLPEAELAELGFKIKPGKNLDPITNVEGAYKFLEHQLNNGRLWSCLKWNKTAIVDSIAAEKGMSKKDAQQWVKDNLEPFIEKQVSEGSLEET